MKAKGSRYARKKQHLSSAINIEERRPTEEETRFLEVIYDDITFLKTFNYLTNDEQIKAYHTLKKLSENSEANLSASNKELAIKSRFKLKEINKMAGLVAVEMLRYPLSKEEHHIIRLDCYGTVDARPSHQLSSLYKKILKTPLLNKEGWKKYNFDLSPSWQLFRQFQTFRRIEDRLKNYLADNMISPDILKIMTVRDFSDLIFNAYKKHDSDIKTSFIDQDSERNAFVKALANKFEAEISSILDSSDVDERFTKSLLNAMKLHGVTEAERIVITEINFTDSILCDLKKAKISYDDYAVGDKIPQDLINYLLARDKIKLLAARDENGEVLSGANFPSFEVHHKVAVSESGRFPNIAAVNYRNNFVLVADKIHSYALHGFDKLLVSDGKEAYRQRLEFVNPHVTFMLGLSPEQQIIYDWSKMPEYQQKIKEDNKYLTSYDDVSSMLRENCCNFDAAKEVFDVDSVVNHVRKKKYPKTYTQLLNNKKVER